MTRRVSALGEIAMSLETTGEIPRAILAAIALFGLAAVYWLQVMH